MNPNDVRAVIQGFFWVVFFFLPILFAYNANCERGSDKSSLLLFTFLLQLALVISVGHSWGK